MEGSRTRGSLVLVGGTMSVTLLPDVGAIHREGVGETDVVRRETRRRANVDKKRTSEVAKVEANQKKREMAGRIQVGNSHAGVSVGEVPAEKYPRAAVLPGLIHRGGRPLMGLGE